MTRDDIIRMALEAGFCKDSSGIYPKRDVMPDSDLLPSLKRFAALVAAAEREACANYVAETYGWDELDAVSLADEIRARGE